MKKIHLILDVVAKIQFWTNLFICFRPPVDVDKGKHLKVEDHDSYRDRKSVV